MTQKTEGTMTDLLDKAIQIGVGLEKKAREFVDEVQKAGAAARAPKEGAAGLTPKQDLENRIVEEGVKAVKEFLSFISSAKDRLEKGASSTSGQVLEKLNIATQADLDVVKEMARVAREKVDALEKKVAELEELVKNS